MSEKEIIQQIKYLFVDIKYKGKPIIILLEPAYDGYSPDLVIKSDKKTIAVIEIKYSKGTLEAAKNSFEIDYYFKFRTRYYIYTDGEIFYIYDRFEESTKAIEADSKGFVKKIKSPIPLKVLNDLKRRVAEIFENKIASINNSPISNEPNNLIKFIQKNKESLIAELRLDSYYSFFFIGGKTDTSSFEHQFFLELFSNHAPNKFFRYCSFDRAFSIINEEEVILSGLAAMNDTTETNYIDNYLNDTDLPFWKMDPRSIAAINRRFIMSCSELEDDLLQWRLYGDNAKGACLGFELKNNWTNPNFYIGKVMYANENKHKELKILKNIIQTVKEKLKLDIRFILMHVWKHFFKPKEYKHEKEIRILFINSKNRKPKEWRLAGDNKIVNPTVKFKIASKEFPLELKSITLGHLKPEKEVNMIQIGQLNKAKRIKIDISKHKIYR